MSRASYPVELMKRELQEIVGLENVFIDKSEIDCATVDVWWVTRYSMLQPDHFPQASALVFPTTIAQLVEIVKYCNEHKIFCIPRGGGAGDAGGSVALHGGIIVDTKRMDKVLELNEKSLTVRVQPGILQKHLEEYLNRRGYTMNHFPASYHTSTVGGFTSTNGTGVLSSKYGKLTDMVQQLKVVLPNGQLFRSLPVNHHSTGPDYSKLFIGAEGTFGIIAEELIKIHPLPEKRVFRTFLLPELSSAIEAGRKIMVKGLQPSLMRLHDEADTAHILKDQYGLEEEGCAFMVGFDGVARVVDAQAEVAFEIMKEALARDLGDTQAWTWWNSRLKSYYPPLDYICEPWMTAVMDTVAPYEYIEKIYWAMKSAVVDGFKQYGAIFHAHFSHWYDWGASLYPTFLIKNIPDAKEDALDLYNRITDACVKASTENNGVVNEHHGIGIRLGRMMKQAYGEDGYDLAIRIKRAIDPNNIMNPGKLGLGD